MDSFIPQRSRFAIYRTNDANITPSIPINGGEWHGQWNVNELYDGEFFLNTATDELWLRSDDQIIKIIGQGVTPGSILPSDTVTNIGDPVTAGVSTLYSRGDHAHGYITPTRVGRDNGSGLTLLDDWDPVGGRVIRSTQTMTSCLAQANAQQQNVLQLLLG